MQFMEAILKVLRRGIRNDLAGQRFYLEAANYCVDPWAKEAFAKLARRKENHVWRLLVEYESVSKFNRWNGHGPGPLNGVNLNITDLAFQDDGGSERTYLFQMTVDGLFDRGIDDLGALALGIDMERTVLESYRLASVSARDQDARRAYEFLVLDERLYCQRLRDQWKELAGVPLDESKKRVRIGARC